MRKRQAPTPSWELEPAGDQEFPCSAEAAGSEPWDEERRRRRTAARDGPEGAPEAPGDEGEPGEDSEGEEADAGQQYINHMLQLYFLRKIVASDFCIAMHWASLAGLEAAAPWARRPGLQTGKYSMFLKRKLGHTVTSVFYALPVPIYEKGSGRTTTDMLVIPPHEALEESKEEDAAAATVLQEAVEDRALPPAYYQHPLVQANPDTLYDPFSLFAVRWRHPSQQ